jgi:3-deoxy-D-manno-octulosonic acid kinase
VIVKPCSKKVYENNNVFCIHDENEVVDFTPEFLDGEFWQSKNAVVGTAQGRGVTWFIQHDNKDWVLRHYYRGGMIGKFNKDSYIYSGVENTRAAIEFELLNHMRLLSLPVPKPIAYRVIKTGLFYKADLLTERVCNAQDLVSLLTKQVVSPALWKSIGHTIQQFHHHNIYHHDLNIHNILIDEDDKVWIIDFDRGEVRSTSDSWKKQNMSRLLRSFNKEKNKLADLHWEVTDWDILLEGYSSEYIR